MTSPISEAYEGRWTLEGFPEEITVLEVLSGPEGGVARCLYLDRAMAARKRNAQTVREVPLDHLMLAIAAGTMRRVP